MMRSSAAKRRRRRPGLHHEGSMGSSRERDQNTQSSQYMGVQAPRTAKKKNSLFKVLFRILIYVVIFFMFRKMKHQDSHDDEGGGGDDDIKSNVFIDSSNEDDKEDDKPLRWFTAGNDNTTIFVVQDFLPLKVANKLRNALNYEWQKDLHDVIKHSDSYQPSRTNDESITNVPKEANPSTWMFTTLREDNNGRKEKQRSLENISFRNKTARTNYDNRVTSYAAWELESSHRFHSLLRRVFMKGRGVEVSLNELLKWKRDSSSSWREKVLTILLLKYNKIEKDTSLSTLLDVSVARISHGSFILNDNESNKDNICTFSKDNTCASNLEKSDEYQKVWNVMLFLTSFPEYQYIDSDNLNVSKWESEYGGMVRFGCPQLKVISSEETFKTNWCETIRPVFNKAIIFSSNDTLSHEILPVKWSADEKNITYYFIHAKFLQSK